MQYTSDELLWIKACSAYYESINNKGVAPIMSDEAFDALDIKIRKDGSTLPDEWVGGDEGDVIHPSPMVSLEKIKFHQLHKMWHNDLMDEKIGDYQQYNLLGL